MTAALPPASRLRGAIDFASRSRISGWAQDMAAPYEPVSLLISTGDILLARVLANDYRNDLDVAGIGRGRHGFSVAIDSLLLPPDGCLVAISREEDGIHIPGSSPVLLRPARALDEATRAALAALLEAPCDDDELRARIRYLAGQTAHLLRLRSDRLSQRSERLAAQLHARRWGGQPSSGSEPRNPETGPIGRALLIDKTCPARGRDAGSNVILSHIGSLRRLGYEVTFVPADLAPAQDPVALEQLGVSVCEAPWTASVEEALRSAEGDFDVVYLHRVEVAACYAGLVRHWLPRARLIFSVADLQHLRLQRQAALEDRPELLAAARRVRAQELTAAWLADVVLTHSTIEAALLRHEVPPARVHLAHWAVPPRPTAVPLLKRHGVGFVAGFGHAPNVDAAFWLVEAIMPLVWAEAPGIECLLAGSLMPPAVRRLERPGVVVLGQIGDLSELFDRVRLTIAPLAYGAGVKGKVLDSMAAGVPCACTPIAAEGIELPPPLSAQIGQDARELAAIILRLHSDAALNAACAAAGLDYVAAHLSEARVDAALRAAIGAS